MSYWKIAVLLLFVPIHFKIFHFKSLQLVLFCNEAGSCKLPCFLKQICYMTSEVYLPMRYKLILWTNDNNWLDLKIEVCLRQQFATFSVNYEYFLDKILWNLDFYSLKSCHLVQGFQRYAWFHYPLPEFRMPSTSLERFDMGHVLCKFMLLQ